MKHEQWCNIYKTQGGCSCTQDTSKRVMEQRYTIREESDCEDCDDSLRKLLNHEVLLVPDDTPDAGVLFDTFRRHGGLSIASRIEFGESGCWVWTGATSSGYGVTRVDGQQTYVHRLMYEVLVDAIPDGMEIDHLCRNPPCCNPDHLEPVTSRENTRRGEAPAGKNARKTHCAQGHPYADDNLYTNPNTGARGCRTCIRKWGKEQTERGEAK